MKTDEIKPEEARAERLNMVACLVYIRTTAKVSIGRKAALGLRHIGLSEAPSPSSAKNRAGGVMSLSGQRLTFCKRWWEINRNE